MALRQVDRRVVSGRQPVPVAGLWRALSLTLASAFVWGLAHLWAGRRLAGFALMGLFGALVAATVTAALAFQEKLKQIAVQHTWLGAITIGLLVLALVWAGVVVRSYQVVRPVGLPLAMRVVAGSLVVVILLVCTPLVYAANSAYVLGNTLSNIFPGDDHSGQQVNAANPWRNLPRLNVLLLGGDGGKDRTGIRTDSMTVASIDTKTGDTVLFGLPRSLQKFQMPPRLRSRWPNGYTGDPGDQGLLNELYIMGERHPELEPGYKRGQRGPHLLEDVIGYADQADPQTVVTHFEQLAKAAQNTIFTNIPSTLLPALVKLSGTVKHGADIQNLAYNPYKISGFHVYQPDVALMREVAAKTIAGSGTPQPSSPSASASKQKPTGKKSVAATTTPASADGGAVSLKNVCG